MSFKTTGSNIREELPYPIKTIEVTDSEMAQLKIDFLSASDLTPYVVCNVENPSEKNYFEWSGTQWISWKSGTVSGLSCITPDATLSPPEITTDVDDYSPTGLIDGSGNYVVTLLRLDASSGVVNVTGMVAPSGDCNVIVYCLNIGSSDIKFKDNDSGSVAENRYLFQGAEIKIKENETALMIYDRIVERWKNISKH